MPEDAMEKARELLRAQGVVSGFQPCEIHQPAVVDPNAVLRAIAAAIEGGGWQPSPEQIDAAAKYLRETHGAGKNLTPWPNTPKTTKKKWLVLAEGTLRSAAPRVEEVGNG